MSSSDFDWMYTDALMNLAAGHVDGLTRDLLSAVPLPDDYTDPFASVDTDPRSVLEMTAKAMGAWVEEARKADYFTEHFTTLSKLIMNGAVTMARGLVSLHNRGEDLSLAPMSIGDLISLGSYQFRKSYLGVLQTVKTYPEISRRLLVNQLGWANTLLRLFKTKERLETPVVKDPAPAAIASAGQKSPEKALKGPENGAYTDLAAVFEPGAYAAPRAYSALDGTPAPKAAGRIPAAGAETGEAEQEAAAAETVPAEAPEAGPEEKKNVSREGTVQTKEEPTERPAPARQEEKPLPEPAGEAPASEPDAELPGFVRIMQAAMTADEDGEPGFAFTPEEMRILINDPDFRDFFPDMAEEMRQVLRQSRGSP